MRKTWDPKRRRFLEAAAAAAAVPAISCSRSSSSWRFFTDTEADTARAVCDCLIPPDEYPGAGWAGAVNFLDIQLTGHLRKHAPVYRAGLAAVDRAARARYGEAFSRLDTARQVEFLKAIEKGKAGGGWAPTEQQQFFALILAHTMQSFYGDPRHGGNRDEVGYRMLGIPATPVRGRSKHDIQQPAKPAGGKLA